LDNTSGSIVANGYSGSPGLSLGGSNSSTVELTYVDLQGGSLQAAAGGIILLDHQSIIDNASITLSGDNSQVIVGNPPDMVQSSLPLATLLLITSPSPAIPPRPISTY